MAEINIDALGAVALSDPEGRAAVLASLWKDRIAVLAFVRHFG